MRERLAFTARYWGKSAVVCRAVEGHLGPVVDQQFGEFQTWTEADAFANCLNDGLELSPLGAQEIVTGATLQTCDLLRAITFSHCNCAPPIGALAGRPNRMKLILTELDLAVTFCRTIQSMPDSVLADRMMRNARNALFNALHFATIAELCEYCSEIINPRVKHLQAALQETSLSQSAEEARLVDAPHSCAESLPGRC